VATTSPEDLLGVLTDVVASWIRLPGQERVPLPVHVWLTIEGVGTRKLHTPGAGSVGILDVAPHEGYDMGKYGHVEVERGTPGVLGSRVGQRIQRVSHLWQDPPGEEVGFVLHFGDSSVAIANLADELIIDEWPDAMWPARGVSTFESA
jgi:hypothetical protein